MGKNDGIIILGLLGFGLYALLKLAKAKPEKETYNVFAPFTGAVPTGGYGVVGGEAAPQYYPPSTLTTFKSLELVEPPVIITPTPGIIESGAPLKPVYIPGGKWIE